MKIGFLLPIMINFRQQFPIFKQITQKIWLLLDLILVSVVMFTLAHAVLFKLHLPSRYTGYSFRIILAFAAGIVLTAILDALGRQLKLKISLNQLNIRTRGQKTQPHSFWRV